MLNKIHEIRYLINELIDNETNIYIINLDKKEFIDKIIKLVDSL